MRILINLVLFLAVAAAFVWWLRPYWGRWRRMYQGLRNTIRLFRQVRQVTRQGGGFGVPDDFTKGQTRSRQDKTVDVAPKMSIKVGCPVCQDMLSQSQLEALRKQQLRCPAMQKRNIECPYFGRTLN